MLDNVFSVKVNGNEDYIRDIAAFVNNELMSIQDKNPYINKIHIALLGCMNITECFFQSKKIITDCEEKTQAAMDSKTDILQKIQEVKSQVNQLEKEKQLIIEEKEKLHQEIEDKNELLNQYREHLKQAKMESESNRKSILELQNKLFESQIELSKSQEIR